MPSQPKPREWEVDLVREVVEDGQVVGYDVDRDACTEAMAELDAILFRLGGAAIVAAKRQETPDGWVTTGLRISYETYMPRADDGRAPVQAVPDPEPVAVPVRREEDFSEALELADEGEVEVPIPDPPMPGQPAADEVGPAPVGAEAGTEAQLEPATVD